MPDKGKGVFAWALGEDGAVKNNDYSSVDFDQDSGKGVFAWAFGEAGEVENNDHSPMDFDEDSGDMCYDQSQSLYDDGVPHHDINQGISYPLNFTDWLNSGPLVHSAWGQ